jgi:hypothetical protein
MLSEQELAERRVDLVRAVSKHPFLDEFHRSRTADWTKINGPLLCAGNWGGQGLHLRGNTRGFELAASADKPTGRFSTRSTGSTCRSAFSATSSKM